MDQTIIKDLLIRGYIGISEAERSQPQDILVNLSLFGDTSRAGDSDLIDDCINYRTVAKKTIAYVERATRLTVEALAADISRICLEEPGVEGVKVRVEKPGAVRFARSVGVEIERFRNPNQLATYQAYISLGSNIDPEVNFPAAIKRLQELVTVYALSSTWESVATGWVGPNFLNGTAWISTPLSPADLKEQILCKIETELGRVRTENKNSPRTIDLDILVFGDQITDENLWTRDYLAIPTAELRPDLIEPKSGKNLGEISMELRKVSTIFKRNDVQLPIIEHR